jgi:hypothetical protein
MDKDKRRDIIKTTITMPIWVFLLLAYTIINLIVDVDAIDDQMRNLE